MIKLWPSRAPEDPKIDLVEHLTAQAMAAQAREYGLGFAAGLAEFAAQLENRSTISPEGGYTGPMPPELREWLDRVKARIG